MSFFQAEDGIRDVAVTGVQTCALPISWLAPDIYSVSYDPFLACAVGHLGLTVPDSSVVGSRDYLNLSITPLPAGRILVASKGGMVPAQLQVAFIEPNGDRKSTRLNS